MDFNASLNLTTTKTINGYTTSFEANRIKFGLLLFLQLISIPCFLYVFYQFARQSTLRQSIHNHVILLLLIVSFLFVTIALPLTQAYMVTSYVYPSTNLFCSIWTWIHYSLNITDLYLMGFACLERNWLIFYPSIVRNKAGKMLLHYCPLLFCLGYPAIFYIGTIFIYKCKSYYDYTQLLCKWPCYFYNARLANFDLYFNNYVPLFSIPFFCALIYIRVLIQTRSLRQEVFKWRRDKKMIFQLLAVSSLYLAMWMPIQVTGLINLYWDKNFLIQQQIDYMYLFPYLIHLIYPFIVLFTYRKEMHLFRRNVAVRRRIVT